MYKYTIFQPDPFPTKSVTFDKTNVQWMSSSRVRSGQKSEIEKIKSMCISTLYSYPPTRFLKVANSTKHNTADSGTKSSKHRGRIYFFHDQKLFFLGFSSSCTFFTLGKLCLR